MVKKKILQKILLGTSDKNIDFTSLRNLLKSLGFQERVKGSHYIFYKEEIEEIIYNPCLQQSKKLSSKKV